MPRFSLTAGTGPSIGMLVAQTGMYIHVWHGQANCSFHVVLSTDKPYSWSSKNMPPTSWPLSRCCQYPPAYLHMTMLACLLAVLSSSLRCSVTGLVETQRQWALMWRHTGALCLSMQECRTHVGGLHLHAAWPSWVTMAAVRDAGSWPCYMKAEGSFITA